MDDDRGKKSYESINDVEMFDEAVKKNSMRKSIDLNILLTCHRMKIELLISWSWIFNGEHSRACSGGKQNSIG